MKTLVMSKALRKMLILAVMIAGLVFVASSHQFTQTVSAKPCCEDCPLPPDSLESEYDYCTAQCGASSGSCYSSCIISVNNCRRNCVTCGGGGGGGDTCEFDTQCPPGNFCVSGHCQ